MSQSGTTVDFNKFPELGRSLHHELANLAEDTAKNIADKVQSTIAHDIDVEVKREGDGYVVGFGNKHASNFYWTFYEFGGAFTPATPTVVPAAESERHNYVSAASNIERKMH